MNITEALLIGVDGGATEVKVHAVACDDLTEPSSFELRPESALRVYPRVPEFVPVPVTEQLAEHDWSEFPGGPETAQGYYWVEAAAQAVAEVAEKCAARRVLVGVGMPGLKTPDGRGIRVINNGPRIPNYLDKLEQSLSAAGIELVSAIAALGSDADYCGLGEQYAAGGLFRDVENAYYVGGGTGLADAMKLRGRLVPFDDAKSWIQKSWQFPSALGPTFEKLVSAKSLNQVYANLVGATERQSDEAAEGNVAAGGSPADTAGTAVPPGDTARRAVAHRQKFPEKAAGGGQLIAIAWMHAAALVLAELIFERVWTVKNGRANAPHRGAAYAQLDPNHAYRGILLDRVVIGQRLGQIYTDPAYRGVFGDKLDSYLTAFVSASNDPEMLRAVEASEGERLKPGFVRASKLRAAPALGAAVAAVQALG